MLKAAIATHIIGDLEHDGPQGDWETDWHILRKSPKHQILLHKQVSRSGVSQLLVHFAFFFILQ